MTAAAGQLGHDEAVSPESPHALAWLTALPVAVAVLGPGGERVWSNPAFGTLRGARIEQLSRPGPARRIHARLAWPDGREAWYVLTVTRVDGTGVRLLALQDVDALVREARDWEGAASRDPLTGLGNRRALEGALDRAPPCCTLLVLDLDGLKQVNDTRGHAAGDQLLQLVGRVLAQGCAAGDVAFRTGGDEFVLLLQGERSAPALTAWQAEVQRRLEEAGFPGVSLAWGAARCPADGHDARALLELADQRMYQAKRAGRK